MSDAVSGFPAFQMMPQTAVSDKAVLLNPPESLSQLPFATEIPALILPADDGGKTPVLQITTETGETVSIPIKPPFQITRPLRLSVRVMPNDMQDAVTFKMLFPTKPRVPSPKAENLPAPQNVAGKAPEQPASSSVLLPEKDVPVRPSFPAEGLVMRSVPDKIAELFPDLVPPANAAVSQKAPQIFMELIPDDNTLAVFGEKSTPATTDPIAPATATPVPEEDIVPNIVIKLPDTGKPERPTTPQTTPLSAFSDAEKTNPKQQPAPTNDAVPPPGKQTVKAPDVSAGSSASETVSPDKAEISTGKAPLPPSPLPAGKAVKVSLTETEKLPDGAIKQTDGTAVPVTDKSPRFETGAVLKGVVYKPVSDAPTLLATEAGVVAVSHEIPLPHLTPVAVKITALSRPAELLSDIPEQDAPLPFKNPWTVLSHALESVQTTDADAYAEMLAVLPKAGDKLPALMMNFMTAATKGVPFTAWLGEDVIAALRKTEKGDRLLRRLEKEFSAEPKKATDKSGSAWKGWNIPVLSGSVVEPVSLYLQRPPQDDNNAAQSAKSKIARSDSVRFVLDLRLSRLGKLQLEGLANRKNKTFSLTIRHSDSLPPTFETDVRKIFTATLDALSYAGTVSIMQTNDFIDFSPADNLQQGVWA